jgi:hypothetical protein
MSASLLRLSFLGLALVAGIACKTSEKATDAPPMRSYLFPNKVHTGITGATGFQAILSTNLANANIVVTDPSIISVQKVPPPGMFTDSFFLVTALKAGQTTVVARSGDTEIDSDVIVSGYTPSVIATGAARYHNPPNANGEDRRSCASCHQQAGGADHSPFVIGGFSDSDILAAIQTGTYRHGQPLVMPENQEHAWNLTAEEEEAIVPYLRSLRPKGF